MKVAILFALAAVASMFLATSAAASDGKAREIRVERIIQAPVARVWEAWTTPEGFQAVLDRPLSVELRPGGPYEVFFAPEAPEGQRGSELCKVLSFLPERMLSFSWNAPPKFPELRAKGPTTFVVVELRPLGPDMTKVTLTHLGWPSAPTELAEQWDGAFEYFTAAWPRVLDAFQSKLAPEGASAIDPKQGWTYLIRIARGVSPDQLTPEEIARCQEHAGYIAALTKQGVIQFAGPCTDFIGPGIVIFRAKDEAAARAIMENDPAVKAGVFTAELHPIRFSFTN